MTVSRGRSFPLGATVVEGSVNFCIFSRHASATELLLFDGACDAEAPSNRREGFASIRPRCCSIPTAVVVPDGYDRFAASRLGDNAKVAMRSVIVDPDAYDWEGDAPFAGPSLPR